MDTINALLHNTNSLRNATILAGSRGLNNKISGVTVLEMSDLNEEGSSLLNLKQGEIVITSCNDIKENVEKQLQLIYALKQRKIAGIVLFYIGYVIKSLDYSVIALCDKLDLPLICPPNDPQISYASVMNDIMGLWTIVNKKDTIFKYIFWERLDSLPIPECCFHFVWCQIA